MCSALLSEVPTLAVLPLLLAPSAALADCPTFERPEEAHGLEAEATDPLVLLDSTWPELPALSGAEMETWGYVDPYEVPSVWAVSLEAQGRSLELDNVSGDCHCSERFGWLWAVLDDQDVGPVAVVRRRRGGG